MNAEDEGFDDIAWFEEVAGLANFFGPGHLTDVDHAFDAGLELDEGAEVGDAGDSAANALACGVFGGYDIPGVRLELLEAECDAAGLGVDLEDFGVDGLAGGEDVGGLGDAVPGDVADVKEAVDAADVDEGAVVVEGTDGAGDDVAFAELGVAAVAGGAVFFFGDGAAVDDYVFVGGVELGDADADLLADELFHLSGVAGSAAGCREEGADAYVNGETAFDYGGDCSGDDGFFGEGLFEGGPVFGLRDLVAGEGVVALFVAAFDGDEELGAGLDGFACIGEEGEG